MTAECRGPAESFPRRGCATGRKREMGAIGFPGLRDRADRRATYRVFSLGIGIRAGALCVSIRRGWPPRGRFSGRSHADFAQFLADREWSWRSCPRSLDTPRNAARRRVAAGKIVLSKADRVTAEDYRNSFNGCQEYPGRLYFAPIIGSSRLPRNARSSPEAAGEGPCGETLQAPPVHAPERLAVRLDCGGGQLSVWGPSDRPGAASPLPCGRCGASPAHSHPRGDRTPCQIRLIGATTPWSKRSALCGRRGPYRTIYGDRGPEATGRIRRHPTRYLDRNSAGRRPLPL